MHFVYIFNTLHVLRNKQSLECHWCAGADWAAWQSGIYQVVRLVRRQRGPPRQMLKWVN